MSHHDPAILAALREINASIKAGSVVLQKLTDRLTILEKKVDAMSDASTQALAALTAAVDALIAKVQAGAGTAAELAAAQTEITDLQTQIKAATDKATAATA